MRDEDKTTESKGPRQELSKTQGLEETHQPFSPPTSDFLPVPPSPEPIRSRGQTGLGDAAHGVSLWGPHLMEGANQE